jgi:hypothetical protein
LRSILTDPSAAVAGKEKVIRSVFGGKLSDASLNLTITLAKLRWSATRDIAKVAEQLAVRVVAGVSTVGGTPGLLTEVGTVGGTLGLVAGVGTVGGTPG